MPQYTQAPHSSIPLTLETALDIPLNAA